VSGARRCSVALAILVVLASCTGNGPGSGPGTGATPGVSAEPTPTGTFAPDVFTEDDKVLAVAINEPSTLDPLRLQDPGSFMVARQLYEGLTRWDPVEEQVVPAIAEGWNTSDGGRTWLFRLREGTTFHDGSPVTAQDFVFAFDRIAQKINASELAYTLEKVEGFDKVNGTGRQDHLAGLQAIDERTLGIRLIERYNDLPALLTHPALVPLPEPAVDDIDSFLSQPIGNGPFRIAEAWSPGQPVVLQSFVGYIDTPEIDGIRFLPYTDAATSWIQFVRGELHAAEVPIGQVQAAQQVFGDEAFKPLLAGYYYGFNLRSAQLKDRRLRIAVNRAIDRQAIATDVFKDTMIPARGVIPEGMPGFQENTCATLCAYDPAAAKKMVRAVPRRHRSVVVEYTRGEPHEQVAEAVRGYLEDAGLKVTLKDYDFSSYLRRLRDGKQAVYRLGWIAEYPVPDVFLWSLFASRSPDNHSGFKNKRLDGLLAQAHAEESDDLRLQHYVEAERLILAEAPIVPIGSFMSYWAVQPEVEGITFDTMGGFDAAGVTLEE
jgi:peptide/nickel transport system substrate-binding protein/oligopeptide transport system substrate-binding protein